MLRDSFVFYRGFYEALADLNPEDRLAVYDAICQYALDGTIPELSGTASAMFKMARPQIDANNKRYENGKRGGRPRKQTETKTKPKQNQTETKPEPNVNVNVNDKENLSPNGDSQKKARSRFVPPSVDEVKAYCAERGNGVDAEGFVAYYASQHWKKANGQPVSNWKQAIITWEKKDREAKPRGTPNRFHNFQQREQSQEQSVSMERQLIAVQRAQRE